MWTAGNQILSIGAGLTQTVPIDLPTEIIIRRVVAVAVDSTNATIPVPEVVVQVQAAGRVLCGESGAPVALLSPNRQQPEDDQGVYVGATQITATATNAGTTAANVFIGVEYTLAEDE